jgi:hypothetical protein
MECAGPGRGEAQPGGPAPGHIIRCCLTRASAAAAAALASPARPLRLLLR